MDNKKTLFEEYQEAKRRFEKELERYIELLREIYKCAKSADEGICPPLDAEKIEQFAAHYGVDLKEENR